MPNSIKDDCNDLIDHAKETDKYAHDLLSSLYCVEASQSKAIFEFEVKSCHLNGYSTLHGGCISTLVDWITTLAIFCQSRDLSKLGVSINISVNCISSALEGDTLTIEAICDRIGSNLAFASVKMFVGNRCIASGSQSKYVAQRSKL